MAADAEAADDGLDVLVPDALVGVPGEVEVGGVHGVGLGAQVLAEGDEDLTVPAVGVLIDDGAGAVSGPVRSRVW